MRPVLLGLNNPHSDNPEMALHPSAFPNSAGSRLYQMVLDYETVSVERYLAALERRNLLLDDSWSKSAAQSAARDMRVSLQGRRVVVLGSLLPPTLGFGSCHRWYEWTRRAYLDMREPVEFCVVPHPSGLSRVYNDPSYRHRTGELLAGLIREGSQ